MYSDYAPRKRDEKKWAENYDKIFGKKPSTPKKNDKVEEKKDDAKKN